MESAADREARIRNARAKTARQLVDATAKSDKPLTHREATDRVHKACDRGDAIRRSEP